MMNWIYRLFRTRLQKEAYMAGLNEDAFFILVMRYGGEEKVEAYLRVLELTEDVSDRTQLALDWFGKDYYIFLAITNSRRNNMINWFISKTRFGWKLFGKPALLENDKKVEKQRSMARCFLALKQLEKSGIEVTILTPEERERTQIVGWCVKENNGK